MAGKTNEARSQLARIPATQVARIEIIRGSSSELDVQNSSQIVNIVLLEVLPGSSLSAEASAYEHYEGFETSILDTFSPNETMYAHRYQDQTNYTLLSLDYRLSSDAGTLNTRFFYYDFDNKICWRIM